ncbi:hypothetical protein LQW54_004579 [Pestalotiopsis sp. IQ-011]
MATINKIRIRPRLEKPLRNLKTAEMRSCLQSGAVISAHSIDVHMSLQEQFDASAVVKNDDTLEETPKVQVSDLHPRQFPEKYLDSRAGPVDKCVGKCLGLDETAIFTKEF